MSTGADGGAASKSLSWTRTLTVSPSPHIHTRRSTDEIMFLVSLALLFPLAGGVYFFGIYTLFVALVSVVTCILTEFISKMLRKRDFVMDGSAIVTGILIALILPPRVPLWAVITGAVFAIGLVKEAFGGLGYNIFNPALAARAFLAVSFAGPMTKWIAPVSSVTEADALTTATPLSENFVHTGSDQELYWKLFLGDVGGCIGETSVLLVFIGALILLATRVIKLRIPVTFIATVFLLTWLIPDQDPIFHILAGGLFLGAFFMATDYVTAPMTAKGQYIFAAGAGVMVVLIRVYGSMPEGVAFSILFMNAVTPLIDRYVRPRPYGFVPPLNEDEEKKGTESKDKVKKGTENKNKEKKGTESKEKENKEKETGGNLKEEKGKEDKAELGKEKLASRCLLPSGGVA